MTALLEEKQNYSVLNSICTCSGSYTVPHLPSLPQPSDIVSARFVSKKIFVWLKSSSKKAPTSSIPTLTNIQGACGCKLMDKLRQRPQPLEEIKKICYWLYKGTNLHLLISNSGLCVPLVVIINATKRLSTSSYTYKSGFICFISGHHYYLHK